MSSDPAKLTRREVTAPDKEWLTEADVMSLLGVESRTLRRWIREGRFPPSTPWGRDRRWPWYAYLWFDLGRQLRMDPPIGSGAEDEPPPAGDETPLPVDRPPSRRKPGAAEGGH